MVRPIAFLVGLFFAGMLAYSALRSSIDFVTEPAAASAEEEYHLHPKAVTFASDGPFGKFDNAQLQRGFQVYKEVCASCHGLKQVAFRDLQNIGYSEGQVKTIATDWAVETPSLNPETGEAATRKSLPSDHIPGTYANDLSARAANGGALPPDLSLITKARHGGGAYIYSILTGFRAQPADVFKHFPDAKTPAGKYYNPYFANLNISMPPPLSADGQVSYAEGNPKPTIDQMAKDVSAFLIWTAEPKLENRHRYGIPAVFFLLAFTWLCWLSYKNVWFDKKKL